MLVTYNRLNLTKLTFESTLLNTGMRYNLVVIDNNSSDDTVSYLNDFNSELILSKKIVKLNENMGIAYGRNMGLKVMNDFYGDTDYCCTLDNDVVCPGNWLLDCCLVLDSSKVIGACGVNFEGTKLGSTTIKTSCKNVDISIKPQGNLGTACMVFRKSTHDKIGYFEGYEKYGHEDALFGYKIRQLKYNLAYLKTSGEHLGVGVEDSGEYRDMKNKYWDINMKKFQKDIRDVANGLKSLRTEFVNYEPSKELIYN